MFRPSNVSIFSLLLFLLIGSLPVFAQNGGIEGTVTDEKNEPIIGARIEVFSGGIKRGGAVTDIDGNYIIKPLPTGDDYKTVASYDWYKNVHITNIPVNNDEAVRVNITFNSNALGEVTIIYKKPLINSDGRTNKVFSREDIKTPPACRDKLIVTNPGMVSSTYQPIHSTGFPNRGTVTMIDGVVVKQPKLPVSVKEEKKGFFSFLKRKKKSHE